MADSPFLPNSNIQIAWDSTSLDLLKTCPRKYQYVMLEGWSTKGDNLHLRFGGEFHAALHNYDRMIAQGIDHEEALRETIHALLITSVDFTVQPDPDRSRDPAKYKNRDSLIRTVVHYLDERQHDPLKTVVLPDGRPAVELSFRFSLDFGPDPRLPYVDELGPAAEMVKAAYTTEFYMLCGHLDRVAEDANGDKYVEDHKTTTSTPGSYYFDQYEPSNQMSLYSLAGEVVLEAPIRGVAINAVQLLLEPPYARFVRGFTFRNRDQLVEWQQDLAYWLKLAEFFAESNYWPQNDTACTKYGGCPFQRVCSKAPPVREIYLKSDFIQLPPEERWNPLANR